MAPGWSDEEQDALMRAWAQTSEESGTNEDLYHHFLDFCELEPAKSKSVVLGRKQVLSNACRLIATFLSLKPESGSGGGESISSRSRERRTDQACAWFRQSLDERRDVFDRLNTAPSYGFVDIDEDAFWRILSYSKRPHLVKTASRHDWDRDELLALLQAYEHALNEPPRRRQCSVESLTYRRFVSRCSGESKRSIESVATKLTAVQNMVDVISGYNHARQQSCATCFDKKSWFALSPAARKAAFDERNSSPHRFFDLDEQLFRVAEKSAAVHSISRAIAEPELPSESAGGDDPAAAPRALAAHGATASPPRPRGEESKESETGDAEAATTRAEVGQATQQEAAERVAPASEAAQGHEEVTRRGESAACGGATESPHLREQQARRAAWQAEEEREHKRKQEFDQALLDVSTKFSEKLDEERERAAALVERRVQSEVAEREQLEMQVRALQEELRHGRKAKMKRLSERLCEQAREVEKRDKLASGAGVECSSTGAAAQVQRRHHQATE